jgi:Uma2 family endonuclease
MSTNLPPTAASTRYDDQQVTITEYFARSFEFPTDLVHGRLVPSEPPSPEHGSIALNIGMALKLWARAGDYGAVTTNNASVIIDPVRHTIRGGDVAFALWNALPDRRVPRQAFDRLPTIIAEVLSPTDRWPDVERKLHDYLAVGVKEVWVVDPEERMVWVHRPDQPHRTLSETDRLVSPLLPGFDVLVAEFCRAD